MLGQCARFLFASYEGFLNERRIPERTSEFRNSSKGINVKNRTRKPTTQQFVNYISLVINIFRL